MELNGVPPNDLVFCCEFPSIPMRDCRFEVDWTEIPTNMHDANLIKWYSNTLSLDRRETTVNLLISFSYSNVCFCLVSIPVAFAFLPLNLC